MIVPLNLVIGWLIKNYRVTVLKKWLVNVILLLHLPF